MQAKRMLGPQVLLVQGTYASALYSLKAKTIQRISPKLGEILACADLDYVIQLLEAEGAGPHVARILDELEARGFMNRVFCQSAKLYNPGWKFPLLPRLRTISADLDDRVDTEKLFHDNGIVDYAVKKYGLLSVILLVKNSADAKSLSNSIVALLKKHPFLFFDVLIAESGSHCEVDLSTALDNRKIRISRWDDTASLKMSAELLRCDYVYYSLLKNASESYGCLHFSSDGNIYPDIHESVQNVGSHEEMQVGDFEALLRTPKLLAYWNNKKSQRDKCKGCELRYACPNPAGLRTDLLRINSAPGNFGYDIQTGQWSDNA